MDEPTYEQELFEPPEGHPKADPAPRLIGNEGVKELMMATLCEVDYNNIDKTVIPLIVIARSGAGKTTLFNSAKTTFGSAADVVGIDGLTTAQLRGMKKGGKTIRAELAPLTFFDEINKWSIHYVEGVLVAVFGGEKSVRWREGEKLKRGEILTLPIGTLLPYWQDIEGQGAGANRKTHAIEQIMRRSCLVNLDEGTGDKDKFLDDYINMVMGDLFYNVDYKIDFDYEKNTHKIFSVINKARGIKYPKFNKPQQEEAKEMIKWLAMRIFISERVVYDMQFITNALRLSIGLAKRYDRDYTTLDDVARICVILEAHAKSLDKLKPMCERCKEDERPTLGMPTDLKCPKCKNKY